MAKLKRKSAHLFWVWLSTTQAPVVPPPPRGLSALNGPLQVTQKLGIYAEKEDYNQARYFNT